MEGRTNTAEIINPPILIGRSSFDRELFLDSRYNTISGKSASNLADPNKYRDIEIGDYFLRLPNQLEASLVNGKLIVRICESTQQKFPNGILLPWIESFEIIRDNSEQGYAMEPVIKSGYIRIDGEVCPIQREGDNTKLSQSLVAKLTQHFQKKEISPAASPINLISKNGSSFYLECEVNNDTIESSADSFDETHSCIDEGLIIKTSKLFFPFSGDNPGGIIKITEPSLRQLVEVVWNGVDVTRMCKVAVLKNQISGITSNILTGDRQVLENGSVIVGPFGVATIGNKIENDSTMKLIQELIDIGYTPFQANSVWASVFEGLEKPRLSNVKTGVGVCVDITKSKECDNVGLHGSMLTSDIVQPALEVTQKCDLSNSVEGEFGGDGAAISIIDITREDLFGYLINANNRISNSIEKQKYGIRLGLCGGMGFGGFYEHLNLDSTLFEDLDNGKKAKIVSIYHKTLQTVAEGIQSCGKESITKLENEGETSRHYVIISQSIIEFLLNGSSLQDALHNIKAGIKHSSSVEGPSKTKPLIPTIARTLSTEEVDEQNPEQNPTIGTPIEIQRDNVTLTYPQFARLISYLISNCNYSIS